LDSAPLVTDDGPAGAQAQWLRAADGVRLRVVRWPVPAGGRGTVLILPGRTEWAEKYGLVVAALAAQGWGAVAVDWRGQGLADRAVPDPRLGHVGHFAEYQLDLRAVLGWAAPLGPMPWIAHSMGGCIALRGLVDGLRPPAAAFSAPMWGLATAPWLRAVVAMQARLARPLGRDLGYTPTTGPDFGLPGMDFDLNPLTRDRPMFDRMKAHLAAAPRLALGGPSLRWMGAALAETAALARAPGPPVPALIGLGGAERIVSPQAIRARAARWPGAELAEYPGAAHELLMERPEVRDDLLARAAALFAAQQD
jgi:lysophospholipase